MYKGGKKKKKDGELPDSHNLNFLSGQVLLLFSYSVMSNCFVTPLYRFQAPRPAGFSRAKVPGVELPLPSPN